MTAELFSPSQQHALAALGLRKWRAHTATPSTVPTTQFTYRVDDWLLVTATALPVQRPEWLLDVLRVVGKTGHGLSQVSGTTLQQWAPTRVIDLTSYPNEQVAATDKQQLWRQLQRMVMNGYGD